MAPKSKSSLMDITERAKKAKWIITLLPLIIWLKKEDTELLRTVRMEKKKSKTHKGTSLQNDDELDTLVILKGFIFHLIL